MKKSMILTFFVKNLIIYYYYFFETMLRLFAIVGCAPLGSYNQPLVLKPISWTS